MHILCNMLLDYFETFCTQSVRFSSLSDSNNEGLGLQRNLIKQIILNIFI